MNTVRIAGRILARELTADELGQVGGGVFTYDKDYRPTYCVGSPGDGDFSEDDCGW